jgi:hypothetical protein
MGAREVSLGRRRWDEKRPFERRANMSTVLIGF